MALYEKQERRRAEAVAPYLEGGETVKESFFGQTPVPPWVFFLIAPYVFVFMQKYRVVVATERNVYVMENRFLRTYSFNGVEHKAPLRTAELDFGSTWVSIDGGPKLWVPPFGPIKRGLTEFIARVQRERAALPAQATPATPGAASASERRGEQESAPPESTS